MTKLIPFILIIFSLGCEESDNNVTAQKTNTAELNNIVKQALDNDSSANSRLGNLVAYSREKYNQVITDSIFSGNKTYYYVLLENDNPAHNRFAVYDSMLTPLFVDKSLNGNIAIEKINTSAKEFVKADEVYLSKDTLLLNRISLYSIERDRVSLVFRTHTKFVKPGYEYLQDIIEISDTLIKTKISGTRRFALTNREDVFKFNSSEKKYTSSQNLFDIFIKNEIENFDFSPVKKQLTE
ncbi:MAG: hypothetical protein EHM47_14075 [Ignavibacteriales bacterium]|nr:MAG: hypothetical protein EHM47_14075 [Ignavibacteriales bacterium]